MKVRVFKWLPMLVLSSLMAFLSSPVWAGEVDILLKKLVEKGVLTKQDADGILEEIRQETGEQEKKVQEEKKTEDEGKKKTGKDADVAGWSKEIPEWIKNTKFGGDLRLRYQYQERDGDNTKENRERFRLRFGAETKIMDQVKVGLGLISGGDDPRSGTETFENTLFRSGQV